MTGHKFWVPRLPWIQPQCAAMALLIEQADAFRLPVLAFSDRTGARRPAISIKFPSDTLPVLNPNPIYSLHVECE